MRKILTTLYLLGSLAFIFYLVLPNPDFPKFLPNSIASDEPADLEDANRRGYFTDLTRAEVINFYKPQFASLNFGGTQIRVPFIRLNYPPEDAQTLIRDQTHSVFLEEIVHPFRESLFINGYEPKGFEPPFEKEGKTWRQKIIVKYVPSSPLLRVGLGAVSLGVLYILLLEWVKFLKRSWRHLK